MFKWLKSLLHLSKIKFRKRVHKSPSLGPVLLSPFHVFADTFCCDLFQYVSHLQLDFPRDFFPWGS